MIVLCISVLKLLKENIMYKLTTYRAENYWVAEVIGNIKSLSTVVKFLSTSSERIEVSSSEWDGVIVCEDSDVYYTGVIYNPDIEFIIINTMDSISANALKCAA